MSRPPLARGRILAAARHIVEREGAGALTFDELVRESGITRGGITYHFPTKEDLSVTVMQRYRDHFKLWINNSRVKDLSHAAKLDWFFGIYSDMRADKGKVCLVGSMEAEFNSIPEGLQAEVQALHSELLAWLQVTLAEGREAGAFEFKGEPADKAAVILSTLQGALQMARALGTKRFRDVIAQIKLDLLSP